MPHIAYKKWNPRGETLSIVNQAITIANNYQAQGFTLTLRQLYYQFIARDIFPNNERSYKRLGNIVSDARLAGLLDWDAIEDRGRVMRQNSHWESPSQIIEAVSRQYREDRWAEQDTYVEVWIEKDALVGILESVCPQNDVAYFACRGYPSISSMWEAAQRIGEQIEKDKKAIIIHLGDHDPSGIDMSRDLEDRLSMFIAQDVCGESFEYWEDEEDRKYAYEEAVDGKLTIERIALNMDQVRAYNPPPNFAKITDSRADEYIRRFGNNSWELDALDPATLVNLIQTTIDQYKDPGLWNTAVVKERRQRETLQLVSQHWTDVVTSLESLDSEDED